MTFVRLNQHSDYGKPYQSIEHARQEARKELAYAVAVLSGRASSDAQDQRRCTCVDQAERDAGHWAGCPRALD